MRPSCLVLLVSLAASSLAHADAFDDAAKDAQRLSSAKGLASLFWSLQATCASHKDDMMRRQCQIVKNARRDSVVGQTFVIDVMGPAIDVGEVSKNKKSVEVKLRACVACGADSEAVVLGKGAHKGQGDALEAAVLASKEQVFDTEARAQHWKDHVAPLLHAQFLVKVPAKIESFQAGGRDGYKLDVVGYRLYEPCSGAVLSSKPASEQGPVDAGTCKDVPDFKPEKNPEEDKPKQPEGPALGERLTTAQINDALKPARDGADACYSAYGIEGTASFRLVIGGNGKLLKAEQSGDFVDTPTGICLDKAMGAVKFPKSKKKETPVTYPMILQ